MAGAVEVAVELGASVLSVGAGAGALAAVEDSAGDVVVGLAAGVASVVEVAVPALEESIVIEPNAGAGSVAVAVVVSVPVAVLLAGVSDAGAAEVWMYLHQLSCH